MENPSECPDMTDFKATDVAYEVQKSFANKLFSNNAVAKSLIDDTSARLLDNLFLLLKVFTSNKEESKKTVRNIIKISVKIGMLQRGEKFSMEEKVKLVGIQRKLRTISMTLVSFFQVDHTYDRLYVIQQLGELEELLVQLIQPHLTNKSVARIDQIFTVVKTGEFLDSIYVPNKNAEMREIMGRVVDDVNSCMEAGVL